MKELNYSPDGFTNFQSQIQKFHESLDNQSDHVIFRRNNLISRLELRKIENLGLGIRETLW